jgi:hypothetical protein
MDNDTQMSEFIEEARDLLGSMRTENKMSSAITKLHEKQLEMYGEKIDKSIESTERRLDGLRQFVVGIVFVVVAAGLGGGAAIAVRPTSADIVEVLKERDCASKDDVIISTDLLIEGILDVIESKTSLTHEESRKEKADIKLRSNKGITGYKSRSVKKQ